jgi:intracellular sulfur oxidation DsrE/DsrF family protein
MRFILKLWICFFAFQAVVIADEKSIFIQTPYKNPKVVFDFYFNEPAKISSALYWVRSLMNPLMDSPYDYAPEFMDIVVVIHGTEIVTVVKHNYKKYKDIVERMKYYHALGVKFKVCRLASNDFSYSESDYFDFIEMVPSAMPELAHWQAEGYSLITPNIMPKIYTIEEIR